MRQTDFWSGFAAGAGITAGALLAFGVVGRGGSRIVRLEKSMQIGRPVNEVFEAWHRFDRIPDYCSYITQVSTEGDRTHWRANIEGNQFEWNAEVTQLIPNQSIGWKSVSGSKHSGRVTFSPLGNDTLVHVHMNYAPGFHLLRPIFGAMSGRLEGYIELALREFKSSLEGKGQADTGRHESNLRTGDFGATQAPAEPKQSQSADWQGQATGTHGTGSDPNANPVYGQPGTGTVEYTRPPDESYLRNK